MSETRAVAIVGLGAILPDAFDVPTFWNNIRSRKYSITDVPPERWDPALYFDPDPKAPDKTYSKIGGWVRGYRFEPLKAGIAIPPSVMAVMDQAQQWGIAAARQALQDYGYPNRPLETERVAVILGNALAGENHYRTSLRIFLPEYTSALQATPEFQALPAEVRSALLRGMSEGIHSRIPGVTEDTMPGELGNIIAGRIANVFNFAGPNFVTDAACASSLAALQAAFNGLMSHQFDAVLTGGVDRSMGPEGFVKFCKIGALSPDGSRPYADGANGFVQGEGAVIFLAKRLEDAERDGDKIYAVVRGIGGSSDGKGKGITAPNPIGQQRALERAWKDAGVSPESVGLIEGHGTSTRVGDVAEVNSLNAVFGPLGLQIATVALGSVKSNIGHLKSAAGAAGLLKTILALKEQTLPPSANFERPNPNIPFGQMPFYVNTEARPWDLRGGDVRRAGVSSFGFGGTNFHIVLEEYLPGLITREHTVFPAAKPAQTEAPSAVTPTAAPVMQAAAPAVNLEEVKQYVLSVVSEKTGYPVEMLDLELDLEADLGVDTVKQAELFATIRGHYGIPRREDLRLSDYNTLAKVIAFMSEAQPSQAPASQQAAAPVAEAVKPAPQAVPTGEGIKPYQGLLFLGANSSAELRQALSGVMEQVKQGQLPERRSPTAEELGRAERLAIDYADGEELLKRAEKALKALEAENAGAWQALTAQGIFRGSGKPGKMVFMFPGQGSQYVNMLRDLCQIEPVVADTFKEADAVMTPILGKPLTSYIFMEGDEAALAQGEKNLKDTTITQPAMLTANVAMLRLMKKFGYQPDFVIGHSLGEYAALVAAEVLTFAEALEVVSARGREMSKVSMGDNGCMAAISAPLDEVEKVLKTLDGYVVLANINSPFQSVIGGATAAVEAAIAAFSAAGHQAQKIPVSHAFHTKIVAPASEPLKKVIERMAVQAPRLPVVANVTGKLYPIGRAEIIDLLGAQVASPVQMVESMKTLYAQGARVYVEVGPKRVLNALASDNLKGKEDVIILATNHPRKGALASFNEALCGLYAAGVIPAAEPAVETTAAEAPAPTAQPAPARPAHTNDYYRQPTGSIVISGAGLGLPGRNHHVFEDNNIQSLLSGEMRIEPMTEAARQAMVDRNITRLVKSDAGAVMEPITSTDQTLKLSGQAGELDLESEFGIPAERVEAYDITTKLAVAAGIEALRDAGIPLVMRYKRTSRGTLLPDRWMLPESLADETGVIFGSAFPGMNRLAEEAERYTLARTLGKQLEELRQLQALVPADQAALQAEFIKKVGELEGRLKEINYQFDRTFIFGILSMGHSQFAEYIGARGPNTQINAACSTTTQALGLAEDWISNGRCRRVIIIAGDDVTNPAMGPWISSSFLASGAATTESDLRQAVLPFDRRRNGMIVGMGAAALVVESEDAVRERGMRGICEVLATWFGNSAFHGTRLDINHVGDVMERLVEQAERRFGIPRSEIAPHLVFVSHETYTPARGGSASAEIHALRRTFGGNANQVVIANTKGFTGHSMAVGIEDVMAVKALEFQQVPPIANIGEGFEPDPDLGDLNLSHGGHYPVEFALRLGAGFGSQIAMSLLRRIPGVGERVNRAQYNGWLAAVCGYEQADLEVVQRTLRVHNAGIPQHTPAKSAWRAGQVPSAWVGDSAPVVSIPAAAIEPAPVVTAAHAVKQEATKVEAPAAAPVANLEDIKAFVLGVVSEKTGYPVEMLDLELDLEADLGIDTVKQAELFATIRSHYGIPRREDLRLSDYNTLTKVIGFMSDARMGTPAQPQAVAAVELEKPVVAEKAVESPAAPAGAVAEEVKAFVLATVSEKTGYPVEMLDLELDLEADLGIDTVKQAELFATIRGHYNIPRREDLRLSDYNTLAKVIGFMLEAAGAQVAPAPVSQPAAGEENQGFVPLSKHYKAPNREEVVCEQFDLIDMMKTLLPYYSPEHPAALTLGSSKIQRRVPVPVLRPRLELCQSTCIPLGEGSRVAVIGGPAKVNEALAKKLHSRKVEVLSLDGEAAAVKEQLTAWAANGLTGVYFLAGLEVETSLDRITLEEWNQGLENRVFAPAEWLRAVPESAFLVCATRMGGMHGYGPQAAAAPLSGAVSGLAKALGRERPEAFVKVVDFAAEVSTAVLVNRLIDETLNDPEAVEVGWEGDLRFGISLAPKPLSDSAGFDLPQGCVFLVSGGTGGITAPVILDLAQATRGSFYLLGRTRLPQSDHPDLALLKKDRNALRLALMQRMSGEGKKVTPAQVEQVIASLERAAATLETMEAVKALGGTVRYLECDITDPQAARQAVQVAAAEARRVDVFLHAAGIERSRRLESKPMDEIRQTIAVKATGFFNLLRAMEANHCLPQAAVFFSSVAGRFGNAGQTDYSAANDLLCKLASAMRSSYPGIRAAALDWGAWSEVGMASRGRIPELMEKAGIEMMKPAEAAPLVRAELLMGSDREVVLAGALGRMTATRAGCGLDVERADAALRAGNPIHIMFSHLTGLDLYQGITLEASLDPQAQPFLRDHSLNGTPVLPGVMGIEGFSVAAKHIASVLASGKAGFDVARLEDIRFLTPFKFYRNEPRSITWRAQAVREDSGLVVYVSLESDLTLISKKVEHMLHFTGKVYLKPIEENPKVVIQAAPHWNGAQTVHAEEIYRLYFHGPAFQVLEGVQRSGDVLLGKLNPKRPALLAGGKHDPSVPVLVELCFQTAGLWEIGKTGVMALPRSIETLKIYPHKVNGVPIFAEVSPAMEGGNLTFDARVVDANGHLYLEMKNYRTVALPYSADEALVTPLKVLVEE